MKRLTDSRYILALIFLAVPVLVLNTVRPRINPLKNLAANMAAAARQKRAVRIAVSEFRYPNGTFSGGSSIVQEQLATYMAKEGGLEILDPSLVKTAGGQAVLAGGIPGADAILTGTLNDLPQQRTGVNARLVDPASGSIWYAETAEVERTWTDGPAVAPTTSGIPAMKPARIGAQIPPAPGADTTASADAGIPQTDPRTKWIFRTGNVIYAVPAFGADGTVYIPSTDSNLYAITPSGSEKWRFSAQGPIRTSPAIDGNTIYIGSYDGNIYAVTTAGQLKWKFQVGSEVDSSPALDEDGNIYFGAWNGALYSLNRKGRLRWAYQSGSLIRSSPFTDRHGNVYCATASGTLFALNSSGTLKWSSHLSGEIYSSPAPGPERRIYIGAGRALFAFTADGDKLWEFRVQEPIYAPPSVAQDGTVYIGSWDDRLYALNPDGTKKWDFYAGANIRSAPAISSDGTLHVGAYNNIFYALTPNGTVKWSYLGGREAYEPSPAIGPDGTIYAGVNDFSFHAIAGDKPPADSTCPKFRCDRWNTGRPRY